MKKVAKKAKKHLQTLGLISIIIRHEFFVQISATAWAVAI